MKTGHTDVARKKDEMMGRKGIMDAKKLTGLLIAVVIVVPIVAHAGPGTLGLIDVGLIGLLYCIRRQRAPHAARTPSQRIAA
jgi:hypothetical protein